MNRWFENNLLDQLTEEQKDSYNKEWDTAYDKIYEASTTPMTLLCRCFSRSAISVIHVFTPGEILPGVMIPTFMIPS